MKEFRFRIFLILGFLALSIYLLYPTYVDYQNEKKIEAQLTQIKDSLLNANPNITREELNVLVNRAEDDIIAHHESYKEARAKRIKLGLDLQGGMYLVMEVNTAELLKKLAKNPDDKFFEVLEEANRDAIKSNQNLVDVLAQKFAEKGIRLSKYFGTIRQDDSEIISKLLEQEKDAVTRAKEIISNRVNQYGVSEPTIQKQGARRLIIELPGVAKEEEAKKLLQGSALLEFKLLMDPQFTLPIVQKIDEVLAGNDSTNIANKDSLNKNMDEETFKRLHPFLSIAMLNQQSGTADLYVYEKNKAKVLNYLSKPEVKNVIPDNVEFVFSAKPLSEKDPQKTYRLFLLNKTPELTGGVITDAMANISSQNSQPIVTMEMNSDGAREWARITGANVGKRIAVVLDGFVYTAPVIKGKIPGGHTMIEGMANLEEAKLIEIVLKAGALPAPVNIIEERTVGPSLGQDSIKQGLNSALIGFVLVAIFMIIYYKKGGTVADLALVFTLIFIMGILAAFQATLTLPGIAGIILTIGMAVDANVLIYERIREELRTGKTVRAAIDSGFLNSYSAIFDSNITTFFTGIILYQFGSGPIQGFALTLMIGIVCSLFSAMVITRLVFELMVNKGNKLNLG